MDKPLPDKWVRKAIFEAINDMVVVNQITNEVILFDDLQDGNNNQIVSTPWVTIPCYDSRLPSTSDRNHFVLMTTQTNTVNKYTKCEYAYNSTIDLQIITSFYGTGNTGNRIMADNILDRIRELTNNLQLDITSGLYIHRQTQNFPTDIVTITPTENIFRKFMRLEMFIN